METGRKNIENLTIEYLEYAPDWEDMEDMKNDLEEIIKFTEQENVKLEYSDCFVIKILNIPLKSGDVIVKANGKMSVLDYWTFDRLFGGINE